MGLQLFTFFWKHAHYIMSFIVARRLHTHTPHFSNGFTQFFTRIKLIVTIQDGVTQRLENALSPPTTA